MLTGSPSGPQMKKLLVAWCEDGKAPEKVFVKWRDGSVDMPVAPYPGLYCQDEGGAWRLEMRPRGVPRIDARCLETKLKVKERQLQNPVGRRDL